MLSLLRMERWSIEDSSVLDVQQNACREGVQEPFLQKVFPNYHVEGVVSVCQNKAISLLVVADVCLAGVEDYLKLSVARSRTLRTCILQFRSRNFRVRYLTCSGLLCP